MPSPPPREAVFRRSAAPEPMELGEDDQASPSSGDEPAQAHHQANPSAARRQRKSALTLKPSHQPATVFEWCVRDVSTIVSVPVYETMFKKVPLQQLETFTTLPHALATATQRTVAALISECTMVYQELQKNDPKFFPKMRFRFTNRVCADPMKNCDIFCAVNRATSTDIVLVDLRTDTLRRIGNDRRFRLVFIGFSDKGFCNLRPASPPVPARADYARPADPAPRDAALRQQAPAPVVERPKVATMRPLGPAATMVVQSYRPAPLMTVRKYHVSDIVSIETYEKKHGEIPQKKGPVTIDVLQVLAAAVGTKKRAIRDRSIGQYQYLRRTDPVFFDDTHFSLTGGVLHDPMRRVDTLYAISLAVERVICIVDLRGNCIRRIGNIGRVIYIGFTGEGFCRIYHERTKVIDAGTVLAASDPPRLETDRQNRAATASGQATLQGEIDSAQRPRHVSPSAQLSTTPDLSTADRSETLLSPSRQRAATLRLGSPADADVATQLLGSLDENARSSQQGMRVVISEVTSHQDATDSEATSLAVARPSSPSLHVGTNDENLVIPSSSVESENSDEATHSGESSESVSVERVP